MKIDLHIHTKKCKQGDGSKRNIENPDFIKKMKENDVGIAAITNHNHFDINAYEELLELAPELLVFPGMELDVKFNSKFYHIIIICEPQKRKKFYYTFDNDVNRNYDNFYMEYENFKNGIQNFNPEDIIIIPHFLDKDKKRSINKEMKDELVKDLGGFLVILEPGKMQTMGVINAHNELSLIGSDVKDWSKYDQYELPEIKFRISSFKKFYELASNPQVFVNNYLNETHSYEVPVQVNEKTLSNSIEIFKDINIIFGEKGSGKTILLRDHIYPFFREKGFNVFLHEGKDYNEQYDNIISNFKNSVGKNEQIVNRIEKNFEFITNYNDLRLTNFIEKFKSYHTNKSANKNAKIIKKIDSQYSNIYTETFESIIDALKNDLEKIYEVQEINNRIRDNEKEKSVSLKEQLQSLERDLINSATQDYKKIFVGKNTELFLTSLKNSVHKKTGKESKPNNLGFAKLVSERLNRMNKNQCLIQDLQKVKKSQTHRLGYIPNKGQVSITTSVEVLKPTDKYTPNSILERSTIVRSRDLMKKIEEFSVLCFKDVNDYFEIEEKISPSEFSHDVIKKRSVIKIAGNHNYIPSEGEKAIITISGLLENDSYDCYLFDEIERGLGQKYITDYIVPKIKEQRDKGKTIIVSTHNSNIAINTLPSQTIYCDYNVSSNNIYYLGNLYTNRLLGIEEKDELNWKDKALIHLEGSKEMFGKRRNIYGL